MSPSAAIGHATVTPPSAEMNCRRPMPIAIRPIRRDSRKSITPQIGGLWPSKATKEDDRRGGFRKYFSRN